MRGGWVFGLLQSIGAVSLMAMAGGGAWAARRWLRRFSRRFDDLAPMPTRLDLVDSGPAPRAFAGAAELARLGFEPVGTWTPRALPRLCVAGWLHPRGWVGLCWGDRRLGEWTELWALGRDGRGVLASSSPAAAEQATPPWSTVVCVPGASPEVLLGHLRGSLGGLEPRVLACGELREALERAWAEEVDWRAVATLRDDTLLPGRLQALEPEERVAARVMLRRSALHTLDQALRARLGWSGGEEEEDRLVFVHDLLEPAELEERLRAVLGRPPGPLHAGSARVAFVAWNTRQSPELAFAPVGEVERPVKAEAWLAPAARRLA